MLDNDVLSEALKKKNNEIDKITRQMEDQKKSYEAKIKNLSNSIGKLSNQKQNLEDTNKDNIRVNIINKLKQERKDQEEVINLLRKLIGDEERVDKYLLKEFNKKGDEHKMTYEEQKIKIKKLEADIVSLKYRNMTNIKNKKETQLQPLEDSFILEQHSKEVMKLQDEILLLQEKNNILKDENNILTTSKEKMEEVQSELFGKLKSYNKDIGDMKSIYEVIKKNMQEESDSKMNDMMEKLKQSSNENEKLKDKIKELIDYSEMNNKNSMDKIKKVNSDNEILKRLLESKKQEIDVVSEELTKYQNHFDQLDNKEIVKNKRVEKEKEELKKKSSEFEEKIKFLQKTMKQKDYQLDLYKQSLSDKDELINEKDMEIELMNGKIQELECIAIENYKKFNISNNKF